MSTYESSRTGSINAPENLFITVRRRNYFRRSYLILQSSENEKIKKRKVLVDSSEQVCYIMKVPRVSGARTLKIKDQTVQTTLKSL